MESGDIHVRFKELVNAYGMDCGHYEQSPLVEQCIRYILEQPQVMRAESSVSPMTPLEFLAATPGETVTAGRIITRMQNIIDRKQRADESHARLKKLLAVAESSLLRSHEAEQSIRQTVDDQSTWLGRETRSALHTLHHDSETVAVKSEEYRHRLHTATNITDQSCDDKNTCKQMLQMLKRLQEKKETLARLKRTLKPFNNLPTSIPAAQCELDRAQTELERLLLVRDSLLQRLH